MQKKIVGILVCIFFVISIFSFATNAKISYMQEKNHHQKLNELIFLNNPPYVPNNPDPANESVNVNITTNLSWTGGDPDPGDTVTYNIFFGADPNPPIAVIVHYGETYDPGKLNYDTQYYWKIDAYDGTTATDGPIWTFHTKEGAPPYVPSNPDPANESTNIHITTNLSWTGGDPDGDPVKYDIYFGTDPNPPNVETNYTDTTYNPSGLTYNTQYYWRIDAWDDYNYSTTGPIWTFTTTSSNNPPNKPSRPSGPANGRTFTSYTYSSSTTDPDGDELYYMFDWDDGRLPEWIGPIDSGQDIIVTHTWTAQGTYNIKVRAMDEHGIESEWSDPLSISMPKNKAVAKNKAKGVFQADLGLRNEGDAKISLNGQYRTFGSFRIFGGTGNLTGTDKTGRFQGLSTRSYFIIQTAVNSQIINIVGKYTSYNEEEQTFNGICRGLTGRIRGTTGWITGSFS